MEIAEVPQKGLIFYSFILGMVVCALSVTRLLELVPTAVLSFDKQ
jgi:hypothetical protein